MHGARVSFLHYRTVHPFTASVKSMWKMNQCDLHWSFLSAPPSSSWWDRNDLQPRCIEQRMFSLSSRRSSHALSHVDCVACSAWIKVTVECFPSSMAEGRPLTFSCARMQGWEGQWRPVPHGDTWPDILWTSANVMSSSPRVRQEQQLWLLPVWVAATTTVTTEIPLCWVLPFYSIPIVQRTNALWIIDSLFCYCVVILSLNRQESLPGCWQGVADASGSDVQPCWLYSEVAAWGKSHALCCFTSGTN